MKLTFTASSLLLLGSLTSSRYCMALSAGGYLSQINNSNGDMSSGGTMNGASSGPPPGAFYPPPNGLNNPGPAFFPIQGASSAATASAPMDVTIVGPATPSPPQSAMSSRFGGHTMGNIGPSKELLDLWSNQVSVELSASQLYLSASIWFRLREYNGMAAWMLDESDEERGHGLSILEFANKRKFPVILKSLDAPRNDWNHPADVWEDILIAEQTNTRNLLNLASAADACGEYGCMAFLNEFHIEQIEAEEKVGTILAKVKSGSADLLQQIDHELGQEAAAEGHGH